MKLLTIITTILLSVSSFASVEFFGVFSNTVELPNGEEQTSYFVSMISAETYTNAVQFVPTPVLGCYNHTDDGNLLAETEALFSEYVTKLNETATTVSFPIEFTWDKENMSFDLVNKTFEIKIPYTIGTFPDIQADSDEYVFVPCDSFGL